jgi:uroporphyrinogen-III decarboxylase
LIYFGGVMDRLEMIASTGADGLLIETSMKGFINDIEEAVQRVGKQITFFGNIDPVRYLQDGTDDELSKEIQRQCTAGKKGRGFILSPASPITPKTPLHRVQKFLKLGRNGNQ